MIQRLPQLTDLVGTAHIQVRGKILGGQLSQCAHGAAIGDLDADSLFYLRSRGLPETEARSVLVRAFLDDAITGIEREDIRSSLWQFLEQGLAGMAEVRS